MIIFLVLGLTACGPSVTALPAFVSANNPNVVIVEWQTDTPTEGWVEYGEDDTYSHVTPFQAPATTHRVPLYGLPAETIIHYRVVVRDGPRTSALDDATVETGSLPGSVPDYAVAVEGTNDVWGEYTVVPWWNVASDDSFVGVFDREGTLVWSWEPDRGWAECVRLAPDGSGIDVLLAGQGADPDAQIARVPFDGSTPILTATPYAHHDFRYIDGTLGYLVAETRTIDGREVVGDAIVEVEEGGEPHEVWNAFEDYEMIEDTNGWGQDPVDWTHANGLGYDPVADAWLLSMLWEQAVIRIDRSTYDTAWRLGGARGDFRFVDADDPFGPQHAPEWVDGGIRVFDNGPRQPASRLVEYGLDLDTMTAEVVWSWDREPGAHTVVMGAFDRVPGGGTVSAWGEREEILTIDESGQVVRTLTLGESGLVGRILRVDGLYPVDSVYPAR